MEAHSGTTAQTEQAAIAATLTERPFNLEEILQMIRHPHIGARVLFSGEIRSANHGREVVRLEYTAHTALAKNHMEQVLRDAAKAYPLIGAVCVHRVGLLEISESAVAVLTVARHRREAYAANQYIIDRVKAETPIWKREFYADGTSAWGENCS
jgi:molybdopterin synthase catalytic subunit